jgi:hypothetical protein
MDYSFRQRVILTKDYQLGSSDLTSGLIFAEMLASISNDDERARVAELYLGKPLTNSERRIVIQMREVIKDSPAREGVTKETTRKLNPAEELNSILAGFDIRGHAGQRFSFS